MVSYSTTHSFGIEDRFRFSFSLFKKRAFSTNNNKDIDRQRRNLLWGRILEKHGKMKKKEKVCAYD